jgi:hypothetical protein
MKSLLLLNSFLLLFAVLLFAFCCFVVLLIRLYGRPCEGLIYFCGCPCVGLLYFVMTMFWCPSEAFCNLMDIIFAFVIFRLVLI